MIGSVSIEHQQHRSRHPRRLAAVVRGSAPACFVSLSLLAGKLLVSMGFTVPNAGPPRQCATVRHGLCFHIAVAMVLLGMLSAAILNVEAAGVDKRIWGAGASKLSGLIIPGFASTRLRAWTLLDCPYSPLNFSPLDPVWMDVRKVSDSIPCPRL